MKDSVCILIGGEAGQGLVTIGDLLVKSLVRSGYYFVVTQDYQSRVRGGHNTYVIRAGANPILAPTETIDLLVALDEQTINLHQNQLSGNGLIVVAAALG
ncbi:MAG: 2-oxoacid:acceptor oxidoreductase family protein, partial [Deltaproteobacteria bacterium]|nr:2-oxoacid:acceptor oxidoreductase family protein [Deltaproteobacteria bacterium]